MLRIVLIVVSGVVFAAALVADGVAGPMFVPPTIVAGLVFAGFLFENRHYKRLLDRAPGPGWQATSERFVDPDTGKTVTVFFNPATGERRYVAADADVGAPVTGKSPQTPAP
jgi:hypothetical protein